MSCPCSSDHRRRQNCTIDPPCPAGAGTSTSRNEVTILTIESLIAFTDPTWMNATNSLAGGKSSYSYESALSG
jgi:hypothetical protein